MLLVSVHFTGIPLEKKHHSMAGGATQALLGLACALFMQQAVTAWLQAI